MNDDSHSAPTGSESWSARTQHFEGRTQTLGRERLGTNLEAHVTAKLARQSDRAKARYNASRTLYGLR